MKKKQKTNYWMLATFILLIVVTLEIIYIIDNMASVDVGKFKISKYNLDSLLNAFEKSGNDRGLICSVQEDKCVGIMKNG